MKPFILILSVLLIACSPPRWPVRPSPEDKALTTMERSQIVERGYIFGRGGLSGSDPDTWWYSWTERLQFMKAPVVVVSAAPVSHGVFREKWRNVMLVVKDGDGKLVTLGEVGLEIKVGDVLKAVTR